MNVAVDNGNSAAKVGIFDHQNLAEKHAFDSQEKLENFLRKISADHIIVSSVQTHPKKIIQWIRPKGKKFILDHKLPLPVNNLYKTPQTLGVDRLAGVCGAQVVFPFQNCLVIDSGTCITYDFLDKAGNFHGGGISPGIHMRFKAMNTFTARLPLIKPADQAPLIGDSTETCMQSGVMNGVIAEVDGIILQYQMKFEDLRVILCGGDAGVFENKLKASIFASPELVLIGLNSILIYNVNL